MGRRATKMRHRSASYYTGSARTVSSTDSFGVYSKGFSFTFSHNWKNWHNYADSTKKRMVTILRNKVSEVSQLIADEARRRCPHYSGALEEAIAVSEPSVEGGIIARGYIEMAVGVLSGWYSPYDKDVIDKLKDEVFDYSDHPMYSGEELAEYLHERYDTFIYNTEAGLARKRSKEAMTGRVVGSHFLSRAYTENNGKIRSIFTTWRGRAGGGYSDMEVPF